MCVSFAMVFVVRYSLTFFSVCGGASFLTVLKEEINTRKRKREENDLRSSSDSIFCSFLFRA